MRSHEGQENKAPPRGARDPGGRTPAARRRQQLAVDDDPEIDAALANQVDVALGEVAKALVATGRSLAHLHALRRAAEEIGFRRGYRTGSLVAGWLAFALASDAPKPLQGP